MLSLISPVRVHAQQDAPERIDRGRFTAVFFPTERALAKSLLDQAVSTDTFPGLARPHQRVLLALAPDRRRFREWVGPGAPEWGAAIAFPESQRIVLQGRSAGSDAGDPREVLRHELAHLALHESLGDLPPRWFDEGYASYSAREWSREDALAANVALAFRGTPTLDGLDELFASGSTSAQNGYALAYRAVVELAMLDTANGLSRFFDAWRTEKSMDRAMRSSYGLTLAGFEARWRQRTRRRYGALALVGDVALAGLLMMVLVIPLYIARRQRDRRKLAALVAADEAAERVARSSAIDALLRGDDETEFGAGTPVEPPREPPVEPAS
ncbi:MAG TPA: hypothetical protein VK636_22890 [Gemmatimonadaceae bacterium]|nr:hypothetical protein [Gemmatimonadaceae bacterium]